MRRMEGETVVFPTDAPLPGPAEESVPPTRSRRMAIMLAVPLLLAVVGLYFWVTGGKTVSTDNAQVAAHVVNIAPEVNGRIEHVYVSENQQVKAGDLLYRIDPTPYRIALLEADAAVGNARLQIAQMEGGYTARVADIGAKASDVQLAEENFSRQQDLLGFAFVERVGGHDDLGHFAVIGASNGGYGRQDSACQQGVLEIHI